MNHPYLYPAIHSPGRISRSTYLLRGILYLVGCACAGVMISAAGRHPHALGLLSLAVGVVAMLALFIGLFCFVLVPRVRDTGLEHPWLWSLLFFVHALSFVFVLALLFVPTNAFATRRDPYQLPRY